MTESVVMEMINEAVGADVFGVWFLIGAALVFFMQAGFAMVESGFTRAKNAGNIIMKNLMDFTIGTVVFMVLGFSLMMAEDTLFGLMGLPNLDIFTNFDTFPWSSFVFNLVFCATAATIVSGAMAERTKFNAYCIYSAIISCLVYPIEACWVWNGAGWLFEMGFIDFAGSAAIHTVGGVSALIGAAILGPRIGKYTKGKDGKTIVHAIPGHSITLGALGVFILWFGWYGFNGAAATSVDQLAKIFGTTTIATGFATVTTMFYTWFKNGKPDVSMTLNGSLAGLVAITAPCANVDGLGSIIIGIVAGILVVVVVEFIDIKLHIDDPVGAVAVHGANGIWGTLACGLFCTETGLFYGGGFAQLGIQALGLVCIIAWTTVTMTITFLALKKFNGLRASEVEEIEGLDYHEHGLASAYADFAPNVAGISHSVVESVEGSIPAPNADVAIPVVETTTYSDETVTRTGPKLTNICILCKQSRFEALKDALAAIGVTGITLTQVLGCGIQNGASQYYRGVPVEVNLLPKVKVEVVVSTV
ncbi:MAG: ammonium transporter, partial [Eubacteriales bacterium]